MMSILAAIGMILLLCVEGYSLAAWLSPIRSRLLNLSLALPLASVVNVLLVCAYTVLSISLTPVTIISGHVMTVIVLHIYQRVARAARGSQLVGAQRARVFLVPRSLGEGGWFFLSLGQKELFTAILCVLILAANVIYAFSHAVLLPTFQYDSATNWTMRSEISFYDRAIAFDPTEVRGMAKPQYPFLFHALQITANQGQQRWNDAVANGIHFLLSLSALCAIFLIVSRLRGRLTGVLSITLLSCIPLFALHLAQGYGDITLMMEILVSLVCVAAAIDDLRHQQPVHRWLLLSAITVASGVWTKSEGLQFGLIPWLILVAIPCFWHPQWRKPACIAGLSAIILAAPWPIFALTHGLNLTPHSTDTLFAFHPEGVSEVLLGLFSRGSFGVTWYVLAAMLTGTVIMAIKRDPRIDRLQALALLWGGLVFAEVLFIYLCTPNIVFLMNAESFYRQMMIPAGMLIISCMTSIWRRSGSQTAAPITNSARNN